MKLIAQVKLQPTPEQFALLKQTLETTNAACNYISERAWREQTFKQYRLHKLVYYDVRETFELSAQMTVRCISKVADAHKRDQGGQRTFKPYGSIAYDDRILRWYIDTSEVSIWTLNGRQRMPFVTGKRQLELLPSRQGESDLIYRDGAFYLHAVCEVGEPPVDDVSAFLGIDLGIKNIATDSDGNRYTGNHINNLRERHARLRARLQGKGTQSAKRRLQKRRRKESRFAHDVNHVIAKEIVERAKGTGRGIALEDLSGIRERITVRKAQRRQHHAWAFYDLRQKIVYKARLAGVPVVFVDPRNTSRTCPVCGGVDKRNRPDQETFSCVQCGFSGHADHIAACNIARRAAQSTSQPLAGPGSGS